MSGTASICINSNPDVSGIGVRVAIYVQNFLSFIPAATALQDGRVTFSELDSLEKQSTSILITALAILISTIIQAHRDGGITNFHASIVLNLSWMNNTNLFIYLLLYVFRRSHLDEGKREDEDKSLDNLEWAAPRSKRRKFLEWVARRPKRWIFEKAKKLINAIKPRQTDTSADEEAPDPKKSTTVCSEIKGILMNPVVIIGSLHLSFMSAIGIWLWSNPAAFGTSGKCTLSMSTIILGIDIRLGSEALRIWSILVYSILLIPALNLVIPCLFFAIFFLFGGDNKGRFKVERHQVSMGLIVLAIIEAIFLIDTEVMLARNSSQVETGETEWTFGQTLAVLVLLVPLRDLIEAVFEQGVQKQRRRLLLNAAHGIEGMVDILLDFGVKKKDLNTLFRGACAQGHARIVKWLLEKSEDREEVMDIWERDKNGRTALHYAAENGGTEIVKILEGHKEDPNVEDKKCRTTRHRRGRTEIIKLLMARHADPTIEDNEGHDALCLAKLNSDK